MRRLQTTLPMVLVFVVLYAGAASSASGTDRIRRFTLENGLKVVVLEEN
jgi:hypothetical protein